MTMVAICLDAAQPAADAAFSACSAPVWVDSSSVVQGLFDGISMSDAGLLALAVITCWGVAFGIRAMIDLLYAA